MGYGGTTGPVRSWAPPNEHMTPTPSTPTVVGRIHPTPGATPFLRGDRAIIPGPSKAEAERSTSNPEVDRKATILRRICDRAVERRGLSAPNSRESKSHHCSSLPTMSNSRTSSPNSREAWDNRSDDREPSVNHRAGHEASQRYRIPTRDLHKDHTRHRPSRT